MRLWLAIASIVVLLVACAGTPAASSGNRPGDRSARAGAPDMAAVIAQYRADKDSVESFFDSTWCDSYPPRMEAFLTGAAQRLTEVDFDALDQPGKVDYTLLRTRIAWEQAQLQKQQKRRTELEPLLPFRKEVLDLEERRWRMEPPEPEKAAAYLSTLPDAIKALRERIKKFDPEEAAAPKPADESAPPDDKIRITPVVAGSPADAVRSIRASLNEWFENNDGYKPDFSWWVRKPYSDAAAALDDYGKFLREEIAEIKGKDEDPLVGDPIGADGLAADLALEMIAYSPEELITIGEADFAWCEEQMKAAAKEMGLGEDWKAALAKVKDLHAPPGAQDELVSRQSREAIEFVKSRDLVTIPALCEELWRTRMLSPQGQRTLPFAAYQNQHMLVAFPTDGMPHADKLMSMRGNNEHFTRIVTPHELIPGHHLQGFIAQRERPYRRSFGTPFYVEGWALYWEMKLWDLNYARGPEDRIGMLFWRMHRAARIVVSLKFHLGTMTPQEMIDFLVDRVGHERFGATSEVRRFIGGGYSPLYQCGYMIGGKQLRSLHAETVGGGRMTEKAFNDAVLNCNTMPIEMVRASVMTTELNRDFEPAWMFAGDLTPAP